MGEIKPYDFVYAVNGLFPLLDSDSCTIQILCKRDPNLNLESIETCSA